MKITATLLMFLVLFLPNTFAQDYTQMNLPKGAVARFGKGFVKGVRYSPDGTRLAVRSSIGIWLYDTTTHRAVALLAGHAFWIESVVFSPDGKTLVGGGYDNAVWLWDVGTGEHRRTLTGHTDPTLTDVVFSPDGKTLASGSWDKTVLLWKVAD